MSLINHRRRSARWHGASQKVGQSAAPLFLDRIDIQCEITPVPFKDISKVEPGEPSAVIRERVIKARDIQDRSLQGLQGHPLQCPDDRAHDTPVCRARRGLHRTPAHRHGASLPLRPRLQPNPQSGAHHRRPRRLRTCRGTAHQRSHRIPQPGPWRLG